MNMTDAKTDEKNKGNESDIQKRVDNITTRTFWITNCPEKVWKDFNEYAKTQTNNNYSVAVKLLLGIAKTDAKSSVLYERFIDLDKRVSDIEKNIVHIAQSVKKLSEYLSKQSTKEIEDDIEDLDDKEEPEHKEVSVPTMGGGEIKYKDKTVDK